jgi:hypothetical protein
MESLYKLNISIDKKNKPMINDIIRMVTIQVVTQFLFVMNNKNVTFFNMTFLKTTIFICLSVVIYWLIIRRLFNTIVDNDNNEKDNDESFLPWL